MTECPECGSKVYWDYACHTWPRDYDGTHVVFMACIPCDTARRYICLDCGWSYTHGLNPKNPRFNTEQKRKPDWIDDKWLGTDPITTASDVPNLWED